MSYYIYKLKFNNGIHIGDEGNLGKTSITMRSDTFFSAIYSEYMRIFSDEKLLKAVNEEKFAVSDLLPYKDNILYIPKPCLNINKNINKKLLREIEFLPVEKLYDYINFLKTGNNIPEIDNDFGIKELFTKNKIAKSVEDTSIYNLEVFRFYKNSGLYFIVNMDDDIKERVDIVIESLSTTGLGGKKI